MEELKEITLEEELRLYYDYYEAGLIAEHEYKALLAELSTEVAEPNR